jgi:transposase
LVFEEFTMAKKRPFYPLEYRRQLIELVRAGRSPDELAKEFDPSPQTIRNWVAQADRDDGVGCDGTTSAERDELRRLKRENKQLRIERDILSKAAAWFARETNAVPKNGSDS